jgi:thiamine-phosphate pyrophosphorylase
LRLKAADNLPPNETVIEAAIRQLMPIAHQHDVAFILNDDPNLAAKFNCDGVHVGQDDIPAHEAGKIIGDDKILGVTCHDSKHLAMLAGEAGADYVAFGAFYETQTKQAKTQATPDILTFWQEFVELPCVAIGGITPDNAAPLVAAGADFIAASGSVWGHEQGAAAAVRAFNDIFDAAHQK